MSVWGLKRLNKNFQAAAFKYKPSLSTEEKEQADIYTCDRVESVTDDKIEKRQDPDSLVPADEEKCAALERWEELFVPKPAN